MERNICSHLGVSPPNVHNTRKRKADDDSPKTDVSQVRRPPRKSRRTNSTVTKQVTKIHSYPRRLQTAYRYTQLSHTQNLHILICSLFWPQENSEGNIGHTPPYFNKESRDDNDCAHDRTPPFDEHVNYQVKWESIGFSKCCCKFSVHFWKGVYGFHTGNTYTICCTGWIKFRKPRHNGHC